MDFTYTIKKEDLKKYLREKHRGINITCMIFFILFFVLINYQIFMTNKILVIIALVFAFAAVSMVILATSQLFIYCLIKSMEKQKKTFGRHHVIVDETHIEDTIHKNTVSFLWKDIMNVKYTDDTIIVKPKEGTMSLVFRKDMLKKTKFQQLEKEIKKYMKK